MHKFELKSGQRFKVNGAKKHVGVHMVLKAFSAKTKAGRSD